MKKKNKIIASLIMLLVIIYIIYNLIVTSSNEEIQEGNEKQNKQVVQAEEKIVNLEDDEKIHVEIDASGDKVPVPIGYVGSSVDGENEIDTGYVIYEGEEAVTSGNVNIAQTTRNQFVWVPVPDPSQMYGIDSNGKAWGKLYDFNKTTGAVTNNNWSESNGVMKITSKTRCREPDILKSYDTASNLRQYEAELKDMNELNMHLEKEFMQMVRSVEKYGGFYIGRYETGNISQSVPVVVKGNTDISNQTWYKMYDRSKSLVKGSTRAKSSMIWGCQWDATLKWFLTSSNEEVVKYVTDSTGKGNYNRSKEATGSSEAYKVNNIYDMAGNVNDWTIEASYSNTRVYRRRQLQ